MQCRAPREVRGHGVLEVVEGHGFHRADQQDPGVIDEDIDASMPIDGEVDQVLTLLGFSDVGGHRQDAPRPECPNFDLGVVEVLGIASGQHEVRAALGRIPGHHQAVPCGRPRDDDDAILDAIRRESRMS